jgi:tripartite-type tricarboxylate transporter receptor subunit TctC
MKLLRRQFLQLTAGAAFAPILSMAASAQTYPTRPVRVIVPYAAAGPTGATLAGHTPIAFTSLPPAVPQIKEGKLHALAVTSKMRSQALPDVPSMAEAGYPEVEGEGWFAFIVPAGTPKEITTLLHREIVKITALPDIMEKMATLGFEAVGNTPDEAAALFRTEGAKWAKVIREAGIKAQ